MKQPKHGKSTLLLVLCSAAVAGASQAANAACNLGDTTPTQIGTTGMNNPSGESLVTGTIFNFSGTQNDRAQSIGFTEGVNEFISIPNQVVDPASPADGKVCPQNSHSFIRPSSGVTPFTVTITGDAAALAHLNVYKVGMNSTANQGNYITNGSASSFTLNVSATGVSDNFAYETSAPGKVNFKITGTVPSVTDASNVVLPGGALTLNSGLTTTFRPRLAFSSPSISAGAGGCLGPFTVTSEDGNGAAVDTSVGNSPVASMTVAVGVSPGSAFLDSSCIFPTNQVKIANPVPAPPAVGSPSQISGTHTGTFYLSTTQAQALEITGTLTENGGNTTEVAAQLETVLPNPPAFMRITGPGAVNQNECSGAINIQFLDVYGNPAPLTANVKFNIGASGKAVLAQTSACNSGLGSTLNLAAGSTGTTFYVVDSSAELITITVPDTSYGSTPLQGASFSLHSLGTTTSVATQDPAAAKALALRLYDRLVGVPPSLSDPNIASMATLIMQGRAMDAAHIATNQDGFYNITIRNLATTLSNRNYDPTVPLNDFVATWIGTVRDGHSAQELLTGNYIYVGPGISAGNIATSTCADPTVYKDPSHYVALSSTYTNLRQKLVPALQCAFGGAPTDTGDLSSGAVPGKLADSAGLLTTRQWAREHLYAGTNRRAIAYAFDVFLCRNIHQIADNTMPDAHIRRDVDRAPGGDPKVFDSTCKSCHGGMDGLGGAYAFFDSYPVNTNDISETADFRMFYNKGAASVYAVNGETWKMNKNPTVSPQGYVTSDDSWINYFTQNQNTALGWAASAASSGNGVNALGKMLASSAAFPACMAQRVFLSACKRPADPNAEAGLLNDLSQDFQASGYNMRRLYEKAASLSACLGSGG